MLNSKAFSPSEIGFWFLFLLTLLAICSPTASAQNIKERQLSFPETQSENLSVEPETRTARIMEGFSAAASHSPNAFQTNGAEKKLAEVEIGDVNFTALPGSLTRDFLSADEAARRRSLNNTFAAQTEKPAFRFTPTGARDLSDDVKSVQPDDDDAGNITLEKFRWGAAIRQSLLILAVQHGYAIALQPKTREALKGKFFKDYFNSVKKLNGWDDKNRFFTNYIAHPLQGSLTRFIYVQNKPTEMKLEFAESGAYWRSRLTAMAWSAAWSTQFELGPISQSSIGNVGLYDRMGWVDLVITPTVGTALLITEDAIDRFLIKRVERAGAHLYIRALVRVFLNPTRTLANLFRFKEPWYRDRPLAR